MHFTDISTLLKTEQWYGIWNAIGIDRGTGIQLALQK